MKVFHKLNITVVDSILCSISFLMRTIEGISCFLDRYVREVFFFVKNTIV